MGLFSRLRIGPSAGRGAGSSPSAGGAGAAADSEAGQVRRHLADFAASRTGVEAFVEPATTVTPTTLLLVAGDGEWTRRAVPDPRTAKEFAARLGVPVVDLLLSGYPQRMRDWNARQKRAGGAR